MRPIQTLIEVAQGKCKADLAISDVQLFNVFTGIFEKKDILVSNGYIAAVLPCAAKTSLNAAFLVDGAGRSLLPGFIDAHVHMESSMVSPEEFSGLAAINGVTTLIADPHEISNVFGADGIRYVLSATENALSRIFIMLPSCVPASEMEKAAIPLTADDLKEFLEHSRILGLGEMMNYHGLLNNAPDVIEKLILIHKYNEKNFGELQGLSIDGHSPYLNGAALQAYAAAGIRSDHEASSVEEATERLSLGIGLMLREGSCAKNLTDLVPAVNTQTEHLCMLCTDDRHIEDLIEEGSINFLVRSLVKDGRLPLASILRMASYNAARHFSLKDTGAIAPGYRADFALYSNLLDFKPEMVWNKGKLTACEGKTVGSITKINNDKLYNSVRLAQKSTMDDLKIEDKKCPVKVIETIPYQLVTNKIIFEMPANNGFLQASPINDIIKLAVFERHLGSGRVGKGFVKGLGLKKGAVASTISHDAHNLIVAGCNDADMFTAVAALQQSGGGLAIACDSKISKVLPLPLGGLFSDKTAYEVYAMMQDLVKAIADLGVIEGKAFFMSMAFLSLEVIPSLKLTDYGLVDVDSFTFTDLYENCQDKQISY